MLLITPSGIAAGKTMTEKLEELVERTRKITMSAEQIREQRQSFAYGNTKIENERITRRVVDEQAEKLGSVPASG